MNLSRQELLRLIEKTAREEASFLGVTLSQETLDELKTPTGEYASWQNYEVDESQLKEAIKTLLDNANSGTNMIETFEIRNAKQRECHYLWFC